MPQTPSQVVSRRARQRRRVDGRDARPDADDLHRPRRGGAEGNRRRRARYRRQYAGGLDRDPAGAPHAASGVPHQDARRGSDSLLSELSLPEGDPQGDRRMRDHRPRRSRRSRPTASIRVDRQYPGQLALFADERFPGPAARRPRGPQHRRPGPGRRGDGEIRQSTRSKGRIFRRPWPRRPRSPVRCRGTAPSTPSCWPPCCGPAIFPRGSPSAWFTSSPWRPSADTCGPRRCSATIGSRSTPRLGQGGTGAAHIKLADSSFADNGPSPMTTFLPLLHVLGRIELTVVETSLR